MPSERQKLPGRRGSDTIEFEHAVGVASLKFVGTVSCFDTGGPAEVFLNCRKSDSLADTLARDGAVAVSLALQYGCPPETLLHAMTRKADGSPLSPLGHLLDLATKT